MIYRWARRHRYFAHAVLLACAFIVFPIGFIGGAKVTQFVSTNRALAATRGIVPGPSVLEEMSESERVRHAAVLNGLVTEKPEKLLQLVAQDFLVMFREPDLRRHDGALSVWQYRTDACVLDVFLDGGDTGSVSHYEIRPRKTAVFDGADGQDVPVDQSQCLKSIFRQQKSA